MGESVSVGVSEGVVCSWIGFLTIRYSDDVSEISPKRYSEIIYLGLGQTGMEKYNVD